MARERISEYRAKQILLGQGYSGISVSGSTDPILSNAPSRTYVVKVDQGVKKRFLQGLLKTKVTLEEARTAIQEWEELGYSHFLLEEFVPHIDTEERYLSFERVGAGIRVLWVEKGGVAVESGAGNTDTFLLSDSSSRNTLIERGIPDSFLSRIESLLLHDYISMIEINPLIITKEGPLLLDTAILVDGAGAFFAKEWNDADIIRPKNTYPEERAVSDLQRSTAASLKLSVINPDGALFFLLSGGGGSIVILDSAHENGKGASIGNYGEYSGGPTREETYLYSKEVLSLMIKSKAPQKALIIAGGVANFTDILKTFQGVIDAIQEVAPRLRELGIKIYVRRGGPNESAGLRRMEEFLKKEHLFGSVSGSETIITKPVMEAIASLTL